MWAMAPHGVSIHTSRVVWHGVARVFAEAPHVDDATEHLAGLKPQAIVYAFTSSSYELGAGADGPLRARLEKAGGGAPVVLTCPAATEALRTLGVHRVALIHPPWFSEEVNAKGMDYFRTQGFEVSLCARLTRRGPSRRFLQLRFMTT
jgi:maleate isomerase